MNKKSYIPLLLLTLTLVTVINAQAQVSISSPYSLFGIGSLYSNSSQLNMSIGGSSAAFSSPYFINPANPASYSSLDSNSFVFDGAMFLKRGTLATKELSQKYNFGSISNVFVGFPVTRWWRASLGVLPFSSVGYEINDAIEDAVIGRHINIYKGSGGLNKAYIGNAFSPFKNFSIGVNAAYIFGDINKESAVTFPDSATYTNTMIKNSTRLTKLTAELGLMYRFNFKEGYFLQTGVTINPEHTIIGKTDHIIYTFARNYDQNRDIIKDTIEYMPGAETSTTLPLAIGGGFMLGNTNRWFATADVQYQKWSQFKYLGNNPGLKDNLRISLGGQLRPSPVDIGKYWERINYRAGFRFEQSYLELQNTRINDFGISFGLGLPMKKSRSTLNLAVEMGTQGTTDNGLIRENYFRITLGTALQERWFLKRKYN